MATVTGLTAERMLDIEAASIVDGDVIAGDLILTKHDGSQVNAGSVVGPEGPQGPIGSMLSVLAAKSVLEVGLVDQIRAGRQLSAADFANVGLSAPLGLWNLSNLNDVSGNGRHMLNKGSVTFDVGINGVAATAARFLGSTGQALYIADTGSSDPFRIKNGSFGAWIRTQKRATQQVIISKRTGSNLAFSLYTDNTNGYARTFLSTTGSDTFTLGGVSDISDGRWHFVVVTYDGSTHKLYVDGVLEATAVYSAAPMIFGSTAPLNIGGYGADGSTAAGEPFNGRIDEAFITSDILSREQIRNLYSAKIVHTLGAIPSRASLVVHRRRRGAALISGDFSTQPLRLYNFSAGALTDEGSANVPVTANPGSGGISAVSGADGTPGNAYTFIGANAGLSSSDTGLPAGTNARSLGVWFKMSEVTASRILISYGTLGSADTKIYVAVTTGLLSSSNGGVGGNLIAGPAVNDGQWRFAVLVEDNAAVDGLKRKLYLDGKLVASITTLSSITLAGANSFRIGAQPDGTNPFVGQIDMAFVCNYALTVEQIQMLFAKSTQQLAPQLKNAGDYIEAMSSTDILAVFDSLELQQLIDLGVAA